MSPLLLLLALGGPARAGEPELHGYVKGLAEVGLHDGTLAALARLQQDWTGGTPDVGYRAAFDLDVDLEAPLDPSDRAAGLELVPIELRVDVRKEHYDLSVGKQYVLWGQTDWINPTDLFTPWDYAHMSSEIEDYRIAPWAVRARGWLGQSSLDLVYVPVPMPDVVDFSEGAGEGVRVGDPVLPERTLQNGDLGARITTRVAGLDLSAMAFRGLDKRPSVDMEADTSTMPPELVMVPTWRTMQAYGGDLARGFGPVLVKAEAAWYRTRDCEGDRVDIRNHEIEAVAGLTWVPATWLDLSVQGTVNHLLGYDPDAEAAALAAMGHPDPDVDPVTAWGLVERFSVRHRDWLTISVTGVQRLENGDHFEMVFATWRAADGLEVLGGAVVFGGPEDSELGRLKSYSRAFAEVKRSF